MMRLHTPTGTCLQISIASMSHKVMPHVLTGPVAKHKQQGRTYFPAWGKPLAPRGTNKRFWLLLHCVSASGVLSVLCAGLASITPERMVARANVKETDNACNRICNPQQ